MKLTKFVHACVLVEDGEHVGLFDPGQFSWESGLFKLDALPRLDYVMITHEHFDHFYEPFIDALFQKFPDAMFFSTTGVVSRLKHKGIQKSLSLSHDHVTVQSLSHESMEPLAPPPQVQNVALHYKDKITHPGDSHHLKTTHDILFLPLAGPWGAAIDGVRMAVKLKPKAVLPIHDWMWNDQWRQVMYDRMEQFFPEHDIQFLRPIDGQPIEVHL
jgi:L-ascorbate metabolism protein UlaG (beta-lactamase superfamily)